MPNERQREITLEQVRCKIGEAERRRDAALNRAMRNKPDFDYQMTLVYKAQQDYDTWRKVEEALTN